MSVYSATISVGTQTRTLCATGPASIDANHDREEK